MALCCNKLAYFFALARHHHYFHVVDLLAAVGLFDLLQEIAVHVLDVPGIVLPDALQRGAICVEKGDTIVRHY